MIFSLFLIAYAFADSDQNAVKFAIHQDEAQQYLETLTPLAEGYFKDYALGDYEFPVSYAGVKGYVKLTDVVLSNFTLGLQDSQISFNSPDIIRTELKDINMLLEFNYKLKVSILDKSGQGSIELSDTSSLTELNIVTTPTKIPKVILDSFSVEIEKVKLKTNLSPGLNNLIQKAILDEIPKFKQQIYDAAQNFTELLNMKLTQVPYTYKNDDYDLAVNFLLSQDTSVFDKHFVAALTGIIYKPSTYEPILPFSSVPLPDATDKNYPYQLFVSDYLTNSFLVGI